MSFTAYAALTGVLADDFNHIYCATTGVDSGAADGSEGDPFRTPAYARDHGTIDPTKRTIIHLGAGSYNVGSGGLRDPNFAGDGTAFFAGGHPVLGYCLYGDIVYDGELVVDLTLGTVTQTSRTDSLLAEVRDPLLTWTLDQWKGYKLIDDFGNIGDIWGNETNGTLHVCALGGSFTGTGMKIVHAGATLLVEDPYSFAQFFIPGAGHSTIMRGCKAMSTTAGNNDIFLDLSESVLYMEACDFGGLQGGGNAIFGARGCHLQPEAGSVVYASDVKLRLENCYIANQNHFLGWGAPPQTVTGCYLKDIGHPIGAGKHDAPGAAAISMIYCELKNAAIQARQGCDFYANYIHFDGDCTARGTHGGTPCAIYAEEGSQVTIGHLGGTVGEYGVLSRLGGTVHYASTCTVTGSISDFKVEETKYSWSQLGGTGQHMRMVGSDGSSVGWPDGVSSRFKPTDLAGCVLWLASDLDVRCVSGKVKEWRNQAGTSGDATQSDSTKRPTYNLSGGLNGYPRITFDGTNDYLDFDLDLDGPKTIFIVMKSASDPAGGTYRTILEIRSSAGKVTSFWHQGNSPKENWGDDHTGDQGSVGVDTHLGTSPLVLCHSWDGVSVTAASSYKSSRNGSAQTVSTSGANIDPTGETAGAIGRWNRDNMYFFSGDLTAIVGFNYEMAAASAEMATMLNYLRGKYLV